MPAWTASPLIRLRAALIAQAVVTGALAVGPLGVDRFLPFVAGIAAGSALLAWFVATATRSAWLMTLGFEVFAVTVGAAGAARGEYVPGSLVAIAVIVLLVLPSGRALFPAAAGTGYQAPVRLMPPPVVAAVPAPPALPPTAPPAAPALPQGRLVAASSAGVPTLPPPPLMPLPPAAPAPPSVRGGFSGNILPRR